MIVRLTYRIYPDKVGGGPAKHAYYLSKNASSSDLQFLNIACLPPGKRILKERINPNFEIHYLPLTPLEIANRSTLNIARYLTLFSVYSFIEIFKICIHRRIDLIHIHSVIPGVVGLFYSKLLRIPYIYTYHGLDFQNKFEAILNHYLIHKFTSNIIVISTKILKYLKYCKMDQNKNITVMPNGIEIFVNSPDHIKNRSEMLEVINKIQIAQLTPDNIIIVYTGLMAIKQKVQGMIDFLLAYDKFLSETQFFEKSKIILLYIGEGLYKIDLDAAVKKIQHPNQVLLTGFRKDVQQFFKIARLSALTSFIEGFPNVLLESMIAGVPVIATKVGEVNEIIGDSGFVVKAGDIEAMKDALLMFFDNPDMQKKLSEKCFARVKTKYDWKNIGHTMNVYYKTKLSNPK